LSGPFSLSSVECLVAENNGRSATGNEGSTAHARASVVTKPDAEWNRQMLRLEDAVE